MTDDLTNELVDMLMTQVRETGAVSEGLADWLESEGGVDITQGESPSTVQMETAQCLLL